MPVPVEYNPIRRMSTITVPKQDINFEYVLFVKHTNQKLTRFFLLFSTYDFQLCVPQNDIKDAFESKDLEASFCRDFACCGLVLDDLHDLLQHYEECHVRLEDDDNSLFDDDSDAWSHSLSFSSLSSVDGCSTPNSPIMDSCDSIDAIKKRAAAYLSDLYNATSASSSVPTSPLSFMDDEINEEPTTAITKKSAGKKRSYSQYSSSSPSALDILTQSAAKKLALASSMNGDLPTPVMSDEDFLAQAGALLASANTSMYIFIKSYLFIFHVC
jgi:hypothetical protein